MEAPEPRSARGPLSAPDAPFESKTKVLKNMFAKQLFSTVAVAALFIGGVGLGCDVEEESVESSERSRQVGQVPPAGGGGGGFPLRPGQACFDETEGTGEWCDCMGQSIEDLTPYYDSCEDVLQGEGPRDVVLWTWCTQLEADFDNWWDQC